MSARPPILFTASYGAGLATGLLHFLNPLAVLAVALGLGLLLRRPLTTALAAALALGSLTARLALLREEGACSTRLPAGQLRLTARLLERLESSGGRIELQPVGATCSGSLVSRWPKHRALPLGAVVRLTGRWVPRGGTAGRAAGTLLVTDADLVGQRTSPGERLRSSVRDASRRLYGPRAPLVEALILGTRGGIDQILQDRFAQSGLVHLLSISGFHVGVITAWVFLLGRLLRLGRSRALTMAAGFSVLYVGFLGWPAPATRAAALAVLVALSRVRQRRVEANSLLSATCLGVLLVDPWAITDLGGWLSATALWGASTFTRWSDHALGTSFWWRTLSSSVGATLATAPLTAAVLGAVAIIGIVLNFAAIPLAAVALPGVFASLVLDPVIPSVAAALAGGAGLGLHALELLATAGAAVPGGHGLCPAEIRSAAPWVLALGVSLWAIGRHNTVSEALRRWSWAGVVVLWASLVGQSLPGSLGDTGSHLTLHFLDVGQGDGAVLRTPAGHWVLIDAGPTSDRGNAGRRVVVPFLLRHGARDLTVAFVSHAHADHLGGVPSVLERFRAGIVVEPGEPVADPLYHGFLDELATEAIPWHRGRRGDRFVLDSVQFTILHPDRDWSGWGEDINEDSIVLLVEYGSFQALFAGDAGFPAERELRNRTRPVDLLKVGHHGSRGSTGAEWLDSLRPLAAVVSVGQNSYGHPAPETLERLGRHRIAVWRTDRDGSVTVTTDGRMMTVEAREHSATYDVR